MFEPANLRVVILDERNRIADALRDNLTGTGILVDDGRNGAEALRLVRRCEPDIVLIHDAAQLESCWLSACKLRISGWHGPIWICSNRLQHQPGWREGCEVDEVLFFHKVEEISAAIIQSVDGSRRARQQGLSDRNIQGQATQLVSPV